MPIDRVSMCVVNKVREELQGVGEGLPLKEHVHGGKPEQDLDK